MTALTTRDALAKALEEAHDLGYSLDDPDLPRFLLSSPSPVIDAATLADDGALVGRLARAMLAGRDYPDVEYIDDCTREVVRAALRALATVLSEGVTS